MRESQDRDAAVDRWLRRAAAPTTDVSSTAACLDPEVMAAWIDGRLIGAALARADTHVAGCARCQAIAGTIARTESIAQWATPEHRSPWRWLTWAVPLTAAATIVTVVLVEWRPKPEQVQTQARADTSSLADARQVEPASPPPAAAPAARPELRDEAGRGASAQEKRLDAREEAAKERAGARAADKSAGPTSTLAKSRSEANAGSPQRPAELKQEQKPAAPARVEELDRLSAARANEGIVLEVRSPDPARRWRVIAGRVQRSVDAGSTWADVPADVTAGITAGAAPAATVCWLAGRGGLVLLTTDGSTWQRLPLPEATDLSAIRATDARNATVTTADGREFATTDGGRTWVRRDLQEIRTAPF